MRILHLYRPRLPSTRAQAIQVLRTCHALAERGHAVTVLADRGQEPDHLWLQMGLEPLPTLDVQIPFRHPDSPDCGFDDDSSDGGAVPQDRARPG